MTELYLTRIGLLPTHFEDPPKVIPYWFEENNVDENRVWARQQLPTCIGICFVYFIFIIVGPRLMRDRKPFDLQRPLAIWNLSLALFSFLGAIRSFPEFSEIVRTHGLHTAACVRLGSNPPTGFWAYMFTLSKIAELGDTVFIVLRKKPLAFLHWFHHLTMVYLTFFLFTEAEPFSRIPSLFNFAVHSLMYTYYGITALGYKLPRRLAMTVTSLQLVQFTCVLAINLYTVAVRASGGECYRTAPSIKMYTIVGTIYLSLFVRLFYNSYIAKPKAKAD